MDEGDPLEVMTHYSGYYLTPNAAYDRLVGTTPSKRSRRDLVADLYEPLYRRGIKLMVYLPSGAPAGDAAARAGNLGACLAFNPGVRARPFRDQLAAVGRALLSRGVAQDAR